MHHHKTPLKTQILVALGLGLTQLHCASGDLSSDGGASSPPDAGADGTGSTDASQRDSGAANDAASTDASLRDSGAENDAADSGRSEDTGAADAPSDAALDAATADAGGDGGSAIAWNAFLPLTSGSSGTTPDVSGHGYNATYTGVTFNGSAMVLTGGGNVSVPPVSSVSALNLTGSYSVSVWVTITNVTGFQTFVSADGNQVSEFYLQLAGSGHFAFALSYSDDNGGASPSCVADSPNLTPQAGTQYHLVATRDALTGVDSLYVDGALSGATTCSSTTGVAWVASTFGIGHGKFGGNPADFVTGSIAGVGLVNRVLTGAEVAKLYRLGPRYMP
jgi:hypothetical protein